MGALVVRNLGFVCRLGAKYFNTERTNHGSLIYVWFTRNNAALLLSPSETEHDIFLEDYFADIDNPTDTELSLLELQHNIKYIKD